MSWKEESNNQVEIQDVVISIFCFLKDINNTTKIKIGFIEQLKVIAIEKLEIKKLGKFENVGEVGRESVCVR